MGRGGSVGVGGWVVIIRYNANISSTGTGTELRLATSVLFANISAMNNLIFMKFNVVVDYYLMNSN